MNFTDKIYIAGHRGVAGSAICRELKKNGYNNIVTRTHSELDLTDKVAVENFFEEERPEYVFFFAAKRTSILEKVSHPVDGCLDSIKMTVNVLEAAHKFGVRKLLLASSGLAYPQTDGESVDEDTILRGSYEYTNEPYSISKLIGAKLCEYYHRQYGDDFFAVMPCVFFGPGDNFEIGKDPVVPTLIHRFHNAKLNNDSEFVLWGTGKPLREYLYVGDVADACIKLMKIARGGVNYNIGTHGNQTSIMEMAQKIASVTGYKGKIVTDPSKPDGAKLVPLNSDRIYNMGWQPVYSLEKGLKETYEWFLSNYKE